MNFSNLDKLKLILQFDFKLELISAAVPAAPQILLTSKAVITDPKIIIFHKDHSIKSPIYSTFKISIKISKR